MMKSAVRAPWHLLMPIFAAVLALPFVSRGDGAAGPSRAALEQEYQVRADPSLLFKLGQVAVAEGRILDAQDFMRRFLADPQGRPLPEIAAEAERIVALPRPASGELGVGGDKGAVVLVDGALRGILPLPLPLLIAPGDHKVTLQVRSRVYPGEVSIEAGRRSQLRFESGSNTVVASRPPAALLLTEVRGLFATEERRLGPLLERGLERAGLWPSYAEPPPGSVEDLRASLLTRAGQEWLSRLPRSDWVLGLRLLPTASAGQWSFSVELFDQQVGDLAASARTTIVGTSTGELGEAGGEALVQMLDSVLAQGLARSRGVVRVESTPTGAAVSFGSRAVGSTPIERTFWAGPIDLELRLPEHDLEQRSINVTPDQTTSLSVTMVKEPAPAPLIPRRPRWRIGVGIALIGAGVAVAAVGVLGLVANGRCVTEPIPPMQSCQELYDTGTTGGVLLGVGGAAILGGVLLVAWPAPKPTP